MVFLQAYFNNIRQWSTSVTPPPTNGRTNPTRTRTRPTRGSTLVHTTHPPASPTTIQPPMPLASASTLTAAIEVPLNTVQTPIATATQALHSTYASRLRTGTTLLVQPILASSSTTALNTRSTRRGGAVNYADPGSGDEFPDAGALDSDDSDFVASGGTRSAIRASRLSNKAPAGASVFRAGSSTPTVLPSQSQQRTDLDQSYLGLVPPSRYISAKPVAPTKHEYL